MKEVRLAVREDMAVESQVHETQWPGDRSLGNFKLRA